MTANPDREDEGVRGAETAASETAAQVRAARLTATGVQRSYDK